MLLNPESDHTNASWICCAALLSIFLLCPPAHGQNPCETAMASPGKMIHLSHEVPVVETQAVSEWESEVVKFSVSRPGLIDISAKGPVSQGALYAGMPATGNFRLIDGVPVGTGRRVARTYIEPGEYCLRVVPSPGAAGNLGIKITYSDLCRLGKTDDHGDNFSCATSTAPGRIETGAVTAADQDLFMFMLTSPATVKIESLGDTDVEGNLYSEDGELLVSDDDGGAGLNFLILQTLAPGRYFVGAAGTDAAEGGYTVSFSAKP